MQLIPVGLYSEPSSMTGTVARMCVDRAPKVIKEVHPSIAKSGPPITAQSRPGRRDPLFVGYIKKN